IPAAPPQNGGSEPSAGQNYLLCKGRDWTALWRSFVQRTHQAILHHSGLQERPDQLEHSLVSHAFSHPPSGGRDSLDRKISPNRDRPPSDVHRQCTVVPREPPAERYFPVENRDCVRRTSGPSASAEPATPPAE